MSKRNLLIGSWIALLLGLGLMGCEGNSKVFVNTVDAAKQGTARISLETSNAQSIVESGQKVTFLVTAYDNASKERRVDSQKIEWTLACDVEGCASINQKGELSAVSKGDVTIMANYGGFKASASVTISEAKLVKVVIKLKAEEPTLDFCRSYALTATGIYESEPGIEDERDITGLASWRIADDSTGKANVVMDAENNVFVSISGDEEITIEARHTAFNEKKVGKLRLTATGDMPSITLSPEDATRVFTDQTKQFIAMGTWPDGSAEVTNNVIWRSADSNLLDFMGNTSAVEITSRQDGLATGKVDGSTQIFASCGSVDVQKAVTVVELKVSGIRIFREGDLDDSDTVKQPYRISLGRVVQFKAQPIYAGDEQPETPVDITYDCEWNKGGGDNPAIRVGNLNDPTGGTGSRRGDVTGELDTVTPPGFTEVIVTYKKKKYQGEYPEKTFQVLVE